MTRRLLTAHLLRSVAAGAGIGLALMLILRLNGLWASRPLSLRAEIKQRLLPGSGN